MNGEKVSELKEWLRENLVVTVKSCSYVENSVRIGLRFADETENFSCVFVYVPDQSKE